MAIISEISRTASPSVASTVYGRASRRRRINSHAGRALEILGHAIGYLADELVHEGGSLSANDERVQAIQILMALNREIYFECPLAPTIGERLRALFRFR